MKFLQKCGSWAITYGSIYLFLYIANAVILTILLIILLLSVGGVINLPAIGNFGLKGGILVSFGVFTFQQICSMWLRKQWKELDKEEWGLSQFAFILTILILWLSIMTILVWTFDEITGMEL